MQHKSPVPQTEPTTTSSPRATETEPRGPQPLEASLLKHVAGGGPKGGWSVPQGPVTADGPKGGW